MVVITAHYCASKWEERMRQELHKNKEEKQSFGVIHQKQH